MQAAILAKNITVAAATAGLAALLSCCSPGTVSPHATTFAGSHVGTALPGDVASFKAALGELANIPVKGRAPLTGYTREQFGSAWADTDHNGCDTRNDILARDLADTTIKAGTKYCIVATGTLHDPYTGRTIHFVQGQQTSSAVQIDHLVPLADAWQKGAQSWDRAKRLRFANDPANLAAVDGPSNQAKGAGDIATWLPRNKSVRCSYAAAITHVKASYGLWMTQAEHNTAQQILTSCK